jgi:hypothetical protein
MTPPITVVLPYCRKDEVLARNLIEWINELGPIMNGACLLAADALVPRGTMLELNELAKKSFIFVNTIAIAVPEDRQVWPFGPNKMFLEASKEVWERCKTPWLWLEPDAVPMKRGWLEALEVEYAASPRRFMGTFIHNSQPGLPAIHVPGTAIYPHDAHNWLNDFASGQQAFDMAMADYVVPRCTDTKLIHQHWGEVDMPPTFIADGEPKQNFNAVTLDFVHPDAVLFHRCKDDSLIRLLREKQKSIPNSEYVTPPETQIKRRPGRPKKVHVLETVTA